MISGKREKMNKRSFAVVFICLVFTFSVLGAVFMVGKGKELENDLSSNRKKVVINYDTAVISYLGPEGTYTEEACKLFFDNKGSYTPCETVDDAVQELVEGRSTYAVIPQENTIGGATIDYIDVLVKTEDVSVVGEVELPISQNLLTVKGAKQEDIKTLVLGELKKVFRPEFLNRVDDIIVFNKLTQDEIKQIAGKMLDTLAGRLKAMSISITFTDEAVTAIADKGFDDSYGARPLRRAIQSEIEDTLSEQMLDGKITENSSVTCDYRDGKFVFDCQ